MAQKPIDQYRFRFSGGIADEGELNFYEVARSQYAAARLLYTLAIYQETGRVVARISEKTIADIRLRAPEHGSFIYDALIYATAESIPGFGGVPLKALFAMVWDRVLSTGSDYTALIHEAQLERRKLERRSPSKLSQKDRKRLDLLRAVENEVVNKHELIGLANELREEQSLRPDAPVERLATLKLAAEDIESEIVREEVMRPYAQKLARIPDDDKRKLFSKSRPLIAEVGLPLRRIAGSAKELDVSVGLENKKIAWLNAERVAEISETEADEELDTLKGQVIQYNKETGYGRFKLNEEEPTINEYGRDISFRILKPMQSDLNDTVIDAMKESDVVGEFMVTRDKEGKPKSLLLMTLSENSL